VAALEVEELAGQVDEDEEFSPNAYRSCLLPG